MYSVFHFFFLFILSFRGQTALHVAVQNGERKICYLLVSAGAPLLAVDKQDRTAQQIAEQTRDYDLAKYLECKYLLFTYLFYLGRDDVALIKNSPTTTRSKITRQYGLKPSRRYSFHYWHVYKFLTDYDTGRFVILQTCWLNLGVP